MLAIVPYRDSWLKEFREIESRLRETLGSLALRIDHIGSTAVPGLVAKDVIDVQISISAWNEEVRERLTDLGYVHRTQITGDHLPPGETDSILWRKWFFAPPEGQRATNTHVRLGGSATAIASYFVAKLRRMRSRTSVERQAR